MPPWSTKEDAGEFTPPCTDEVNGTGWHFSGELLVMNIAVDAWSYAKALGFLNHNRISF